MSRKKGECLSGRSFRRTVRTHRAGWRRRNRVSRKFSSFILHGWQGLLICFFRPVLSGLSPRSHIPAKGANDGPVRNPACPTAAVQGMPSCFPAGGRFPLCCLPAAWGDFFRLLFCTVCFNLYLCSRQSMRFNAAIQYLQGKERGTLAGTCHACGLRHVQRPRHCRPLSRLYDGGTRWLLEHFHQELPDVGI